MPVGGRCVCIYIHIYIYRRHTLVNGLILPFWLQVRLSAALTSPSHFSPSGLLLISILFEGGGSRKEEMGHLGQT